MKSSSRSIFAALLATFLLAGCGDEAGPTAAQSTSASRSGSTGSTPSAAGPSGELLTDGVGEVRQGASPAEVVELFGEPTEERRFSGCEFNPESSAIIQYGYEMSGGTLSINFDARTNEMTSYRTDSPELETSLGDSVGDPFETLESNWGGSLQPLVLGSEEPSAEQGSWFVREGARNQLSFAISRGRIAMIQGGYLPPCE